MKIVFLLFDGVTQLDFTGPLQVLSRAKGAEIHIAAKSSDPIETDSVLRLLPTTTFEDCPLGDVLVVPGGHGVRQAVQDKATIEFVKRQAAACRYITSVCTGAFILGKAGLLSGKRATTHWAYTGLLERMGALYEKARVVEDGRIISGGGVTAGIDFAFTLLARIDGEDHARAIQLALEYDPGPPFEGGTPDNTPPLVREGVVSHYESFMEEFAKELERGLV